MIVRAVIDLLGGMVVRGVRGQRELYRPIESKLTGSTAPRDIALAIQEATGIRDFYIADLDAIQKGTKPDWDLMAWIQGKGWSFWLDSGLRTTKELVHWPVDLACPVIGTETFEETPSRLFSSQKVNPVLSLDNLNGKLIGKGQILFPDPKALWKGWKETGIEDLILMDLAKVGSYCGPTGISKTGENLTNPFTYQPAKVHAAGGVRNLADLKFLEQAGFQSALVASYIHDGAFPGNHYEKVFENTD